MSMAMSSPRRVNPIVGKIIGTSELNQTSNSYDVVNFKIQTEQKNSLGLVMKTIKRVCLFFEQAIEASETLAEGDYVCFDECSTQDRCYTSKNSGEKVLTSDIIAKQFCKLSAEQFAEIAGTALEMGSEPKTKNKLVDWD